MNQTKKDEKTYCIDGLKGMGAFLIAFVWHYQHFAPQAGTPFYSLFAPFYDRGDRVVELFLMLSGLGMAIGYEEKIQKKEISFGQYMGKRIAKLFPLMWITLFATLLLQCIYMWKMGTIFVYPNLDVYHFLLNLVGLQNGLLETQWSYNAPSWCVSVLLVCYAIFYFVVLKDKGDDVILTFKYAMIAAIGCIVILLGYNIPILNSQIGRGIAAFLLVQSWQKYIKTEV